MHTQAALVLPPLTHYCLGFLSSGLTSENRSGGGGGAVLFPSRPVSHQSERKKRQKQQQKALCVAHEQEWRQPSRRQTSVNQLNSIPEYKEYNRIGEPGDKPQLALSGTLLSQALVCGSRVLWQST